MRLLHGMNGYICTHARASRPCIDVDKVSFSLEKILVGSFPG